MVNSSWGISNRGQNVRVKNHIVVLKCSSCVSTTQGVPRSVQAGSDTWLVIGSTYTRKVRTPHRRQTLPQWKGWPMPFHEPPRAT